MMANENEFNFQVSAGANSMKAKFDLETGEDVVTADVSNFIEAAKIERHKEEYYGNKFAGNYRKLATVPDIVAMKILVDHKLDLHDPCFGNDPNNLKKLKQILISEYRDLVINT